MGILHPRRSLRLSNFDYSSTGYYFVTICTKNRICFFGDIHSNEYHEKYIELSSIGKIAEQCWSEIPFHFGNVVLDVFCVMPDHMHGIIVVDHDVVNQTQLHVVGNAHGNNDKSQLHVVGNAHGNSLRLYDQQHIRRMKMVLPNVINGFKSSVTRMVRRKLQDYSFTWQKSYHDHIIRNNRELENIRHYIQYNPQKSH